MALVSHVFLVHNATSLFNRIEVCFAAPTFPCNIHTRMYIVLRLFFAAARLRGISAGFLLLLPASLSAQSEFYDLGNVPLTDLSAFRPPGANWQIVGAAQGDPQNATLNSRPGTGVLFNNFDKNIRYQNGANLFSSFEHGDLYLELDFMLPKGSNSGIYLQGRYEVQLFDSRGVQKPKHSDCGGIYQRWEEAGQRGYEGHPPRVNACLAPGLWQHLEVLFQAPKFDASGRKVQPAQMSKVVLNGVVLHENVVLHGPTRAAAFENEAAKGPLMIQGDHGPLAFRNIRYAFLNDFQVPLSDVTYEYYEGRFERFSELTPDKLTRKGKVPAVDFNVADNVNLLGLSFKGKIQLPETGDYLVWIKRNGTAQLSIDGREVFRAKWKMFHEDSIAKVRLTAGEHTFSLDYIKNFSWAPTTLGLFIQKANARPYPLHARASMPDPRPAPQIEVTAEKTPELHRSYFFHGDKKKTHVISVGTPEGVHFAYDLNQAALLQVWKGPFSDATDMWYERGEPQTSKAMGAGAVLAGLAPVLPDWARGSVLPDSLDDHKTLIYKGYTLDENRLPTFLYRLQGMELKDRMAPSMDGKGLLRQITLNNNSGKNALLRLAAGKTIVDLGKGLYAVDDHRYYVQVPDFQTKKYAVASVGNRQELVLETSEARAEILYHIVF
jgi:Domain of Unknown Function (DUF1080)